jgi:hypothetical protein
MAVAQVYITTNGGKTWFPWDGLTTTTAFDSVATDDPGAGARASITLDPVEGRSYVITGIGGSFAGLGKHRRMALRLTVNGELKWSSHFVAAQPSTFISVNGLNLKFSPEAQINLSWLDAPGEENFCTVIMTYHLVE